MTNNQLARERLEKIKSWRETYGVGSNVMLPAEEAEELARIALAAIDSEPVAWLAIYHGEPRLHIKEQPAPVTTSEEHRQLRDLVMMVKMLCRTIRKYNPESQQAADYTVYLQKEGLISAADCLRGSDPKETDTEDRRG